NLLEQPAAPMKMYLTEGRDKKLVEDGHLYDYTFQLDGDPDQVLHIYTSFENPGQDTVIIYGQKKAVVDPVTMEAWCMLGNCWGDNITADAYPLLPGATIESEPGGDQHYIDYTPDGYVGTGYVYYTFYDKENPANRVNFAVAWTTKKDTTANERTADAVKTAVYPNPAVTTARLTWEAVEGAVVLNVRSVSGQLLYSRPVEGQTEAEINVAGFTPGMYFYTLERQGERLAGGKLLVR
ncbi:MAG: T9SS type A sorting domain-containing protein, partial [Bacteroidales bacterium]|nr:T9SS type A sorting domain-containing protein [Bacteroidales bacterium]